jgi:hypothetical protein
VLRCLANLLPATLSFQTCVLSPSRRRGGSDVVTIHVVRAAIYVQCTPALQYRRQHRSMLNAAIDMLEVQDAG